MKNFGIIFAATVILASMAVSASAGDRVLSIPTATLSSMGLGGVHQMSDSAGLAVRGMGTEASVWGSSYASFGSNHSSNGYSAESEHRHGSSLAAGANLSFAGTASNHGFTVNFAGGASVAFAK